MARSAACSSAENGPTAVAGSASRRDRRTPSKFMSPAKAIVMVSGALRSSGAVVVVASAVVVDEPSGGGAAVGSSSAPDPSKANAAARPTTARSPRSTNVSRRRSGVGARCPGPSGVVTAPNGGSHHDDAVRVRRASD